MALSDPNELFTLRASDVPAGNLKLGYVYVLRISERRDIVKVGITHNHPIDRAKKLNSQTGSLGGFFPVFWFKIAAIRSHERLIFHALDSYRFRKNKEFFCISPARAYIALSQYFERKPDWACSDVEDMARELKELDDEEWV